MPEAEQRLYKTLHHLVVTFTTFKLLGRSLMPPADADWIQTVLMVGHELPINEKKIK